MLGLSSFKSFKILTRTFPELRFDGPEPNLDEFLRRGLLGGTLKVEKLPGELWEVLFPPLSEGIVHALYRFLIRNETSTYSFFTHFFDIFLRLSTHKGLTRAGAEAAAFVPSPQRTSPSKAHVAAAARAVAAEKEGAGSALKPSGRRSIQVTDVASLKYFHEEMIGDDFVKGPIELVFRKSDGSTSLVVEVKRDLYNNWEAHICQMAAHLYTTLGKEHALKRKGPVFGVLTDVESWVLFEISADDPGKEKPFKATIKYSITKNCLNRVRDFQWKVGDEEDLQDVVAFVADCFCPGIGKQTHEMLLEKLESYQTEVQTSAKAFRQGKELNPLGPNRSLGAGDKRARDQDGHEGSKKKAKVESRRAVAST